MCIKNADFVAHTDNKPVTVYKAVLRRNEYDEAGQIVGYRRETPFRAVSLPEEVLNGTVPFEAGPVLRGDNPENYFEVNSGYIHTYKDLRSAVSDYIFYYTRAVDNNRCSTEIYECEIPACEDHYWEGIFDDNYNLKCIGAKRIYFKRKLTEEELRALAKEFFEE